MTSTLTRRVITAFAFLLAIATLDSTASAKDRWLEIIEIYELPNDPAWPSSARSAGAVVGRFEGNPRRMPFPETAERFGDRMSKAGDNDRSREAVRMAVRNFAERLTAGSKQLPKLKVIRAWDGYARQRVEFVCGPEQGSVIQASKAGAIFKATIGTSNSPDHWQAAGRPTILQINRAVDVPSDFVSLDKISPALRDITFGKLAMTPEAPACIGIATKDPSPGGTRMDISFKGANSGVPIDLSYPYYCEFRVFQKAQDGSREREVRFKGPKHAVAIGGDAVATVELRDKPSAFGYEAEAVAWFGVASRDSLAPDGKRLPLEPEESPEDPSEPNP